MVSQRIIQFIANLPQYQDDKVKGAFVATRLTDGTIFLSPPDPEDAEHGLLIARWQGDSSRESTVSGVQIAEIAIVEAVKHWGATGEMNDEQESIRHLFQHFYHKTGERISLPPEPFLSKQMQKFLKFIGTESVKKLIGF